MVSIRKGCSESLTTLGKLDGLLHRRENASNCAPKLNRWYAPEALGMLAAALGYLPPIAGAIDQEFIDLLAVLNALRASPPVGNLQDF